MGDRIASREQFLFFFSFLSFSFPFFFLPLSRFPFSLCLFFIVISRLQRCVCIQSIQIIVSQSDLISCAIHLSSSQLLRIYVYICIQSIYPSLRMSREQKEGKRDREKGGEGGGGRRKVGVYIHFRFGSSS